MSDGISEFLGHSGIFLRCFIFSFILILFILLWFFHSSTVNVGKDIYLSEALIDDSSVSALDGIASFSFTGSDVSDPIEENGNRTANAVSISALPALPTPPALDSVESEDDSSVGLDGFSVSPSEDDLAKNSLVVVRSSSDASSALVPAPIGDLIELAPGGYLIPKRSEMGRRSFNVYARPPVPLSPSTVRGRIALLIGGMGLSDSLTRSAINFLPGSVSLAFAPYGENVSVLATLAREDGHEIFLQLPMEPYGWPETNPGLHTLLVDSGVEDNLSRLHWHMSRFSGYVGVMNYMGGRFLSLGSSLEPILSELHARGLGYFDDGSVSRNVSEEISSVLGLPFGRADFIIDLDSGLGSIDLALRNLEQEALDRGLVVAVGSALPSTLEGIDRWLRGLSSRGITLVPLSSVLRGGDF